MPLRLSSVLAYGWMCALSTVCAVSASLQTGAEGIIYHSPGALAADPGGQAIYVNDETASAIVRVDLLDNSTRTLAVPGRPTSVAVGNSGRIYVTGDGGVVWIVNPATGSLEATIAVGHAPRCAVLNADESLLYVCNRFDNDVSVVDVKRRREISRIRAGREPIAAALTPDGKFLVIANEKPAGPATSSQVASTVTIADAVGRTPIADIALLDGGVSVRDIAISPDAKYAFVTHILGRHHQPATQLDEGWLVTNAVSVIDLDQRTRLGTVLLDQPRRGAANPWGVAVTDDGLKLCVSLAGTHELAVIDLSGLLQRLRVVKNDGSDAPPRPYRTGGPDTDLGFLRDHLTRKALTGRGPRPLVIKGGRAYVGMYFTGTIEAVRLDDLAAAASVITIGAQLPETDVRRGERLFNDATLAFQGWLSCSTCHPEGRSDGLNWDLSNDGIGNPKNAKSLMLSYKTPPVMWTGLFPSLDECVPFEVRTILFSARPAHDSAAIVAYLSSLKPGPSPFLENGKLSASARRGASVVQKAGCDECHRGELLTTMEKRSVGVYTAGDPDEFDIPTWREVWRTGPYLHDGRAVSVKDIFTRFDPQNGHGKHQNLTPQELDDLVQYVLSQ
jgi:YVTN family beta-propeller protein